MEEQGHKNSNTTLPTVETEERNFISPMTKKDEKNQEDVPMTDPDVGVNDPMHNKEKHTLLEELLHPTNGNASSVKRIYIYIYIHSFLYNYIT